MRKDILTARVRRGAALLDAHRPGWEWRINLETLNLEDYTVCVLGQLGREEADFIPYNRMLQKIGLSMDNTAQVAHGFELLVRGAGGRLDEKSQANWDQLTSIWREAIEEKRKHAKRDQD